MNTVVDALVPLQVQDEIALAAFVSEKADIVLDPDFVKHIHDSVLRTEWNWAVGAAVHLIAELAFLRISGNVLYSQLVRHFAHFPSSLRQFIFPVFFS
jgi:hypothetical protein